MINNRVRLSQRDTSHARLALIFGGRAAEQMNIGRDPYHAARLAASYAARVQVVTGLHGVCGPVIGAIAPAPAVDIHALAERMRREEKLDVAAGVCVQCGMPLADWECGPRCGRCKDSDREPDEAVR